MKWVCDYVKCFGIFCFYGELNFGCLNVVFCVVLGGGEEIFVKKLVIEGEFIKILECEWI